jgi:hypothetical protein
MNPDAASGFREWVERHVHECAPDHSTQTVSVGFLRDTARKMDAVCDALDIAATTLWAVTLLIRHEFDGDGGMHWMRDPKIKEANAFMSAAETAWSALRLERDAEA